MHSKLFVALCCLTASAAVWSEPARQLYALNCMGCHAIPENDRNFHSQPSYSAEFRQAPKKRSFFIRMPEANQPPLSEVENTELIAEILTWAKACPQMPPGMPLNRPGLSARLGK